MKYNCMRVASSNITFLDPQEIFVFGSNLSGFHDGGAAKLAMSFGAIYGQGVGEQGQTFAIPTKDYGISRTLTVEEIKPYIDAFINYANEPQNQDLKFLVTDIGCGLAGHKHEDIAPLFKEALNIKTIYLPLPFLEILNK